MHKYITQDLYSFIYLKIFYKIQIFCLYKPPFSDLVINQKKIKEILKKERWEGRMRKVEKGKAEIQGKQKRERKKGTGY